MMFEPHANDEDKLRVGHEAMQILRLAEQNVLGASEYAAPVENITLLLGQCLESKDKPFAKSGSLIQAIVRELLHHLDGTFVSFSLDWLNQTINVPFVGPITSDQEKIVLTQIELVTNNLLSSLIDKGWSLESLFQLHQWILVPRLPLKSAEGQDPQYNFVDAFENVRNRLISPPKPYTVVFAVQNVSKPDLFPKQIADISFESAPPLVSEDSNDYARSYAKAASNKLFAKVTVKAQDGREAGMLASDKISHILDLVRFEYERKSILIPDQFLLIKDNDRCTRLTIPKVVPNPQTDWQPAELEEFVRKLEELAASGTLPEEAKDRIYSAFRLYRVGADTRNFENKLVNWWTAIEYLVKGGSGGGIGDGVERALVPVLSLMYIAKHLETYKSQLIQLRININDPVNGATVDLRNLSTVEFYKFLIHPTVIPRVESACNIHPYLWLKLEAFMEALRDPSKIATMMKSHERKLGWNIQRIYRARCDIVHSAQRRVNSTLLCAHLEFYLKCVLRTFLKSLHSLPTLRDPKEFFERKRYAAQRIGEDLVHGKVESLLAHFE